MDGCGSKTVLIDQFTPRNGKAVEINAFYYVNLQFVAEALVMINDEEGIRRYIQIAAVIETKFLLTFSGMKQHKHCMMLLMEIYKVKLFVQIC